MMDDTNDFYTEIGKTVRAEVLDKIILLERAANQRHWAKQLERALHFAEPLIGVKSVIASMREEADRYDTLRKKT